MSTMSQSVTGPQQSLPDQRPGGSQGTGAPLVFVHIPKTAGTTFRKVLERRFRREEIYPPYLYSELAGEQPEDAAPYRFVRGHFFYDVLRRLLPSTAVYITFLRDPIERALSTYAHVQNRPDSVTSVMLGWLVSRDLEELVFHPTAPILITNVQTRTLGAVLDCDGWDGWQEGMKQEGREAALGKHARAEDALAVLESFAFFGLAERFNDSMALLAHTMGWSPIADYTSHNVAPQRPAREAIPTHVLDRLRELNQEDIRLYEHARQLFERRYSAMMAELLARDGRARER